MTNIMAIRTGYVQGKEAVYLLADSQASGQKEKSVVQKLFRRGGCLITGTGTGYRLMGIVDDLRTLGEDSKPSYVAERVVDRGKKFNSEKQSKFRKAKGSQSADFERLLIVGLEDGKPTIYSVVLSDESFDPESNLEPILKVNDFMAHGGSGSSQTQPALKRDFEMGNIRLGDLEEGLSFCFSYGDKAGEDMWVDNRLQIGIVTPDFTRLLCHPEVPADSLYDHIKYFSANLGLDFPEKIDDEIFDGLSDISSVFNDFYQAVLVNCKTMSGWDRKVNSANTNSKTDKTGRECNEKERLEFLGKRDEYKGYIKELVDAWTGGKLPGMVEALKIYNARRLERHNSAVDFVENIKDKGASQQSK